MKKKEAFQFGSALGPFLDASQFGDLLSSYMTLSTSLYNFHPHLAVYKIVFTSKGLRMSKGPNVCSMPSIEHPGENKQSDGSVLSPT